ncbi:MAG TPA: class I SAM-dependent methyltransferase [Chitinophagaceae bacterium]|nr:class I SAM-dependent methyltransferase [Chitinophagaceae bacterium]
MKCRICQNEEGNISFELTEMMYGFRDKFNYFQCAACECIQIVSPPADMSKYYPGDYYSYTADKTVKRSGLFQRLQCRSFVRGNRSLFGKIITYKYKPPEFYQTLKNLKLLKLSSPVLDVGSGSGELLKNFYKAGYNDLTGIDPYIEKDIVYNDELRIEKKELFDVSREFDAIMLNHSLEHMDQQLEVLKKIYSILSKDGRLLIRIPIVSKPLMEEYGLNVVSLDAPRHFYIHSFKSISLLAEKAGFITEKVIYDAHEFSFWGSELYKNGISLQNDPESYLVKKTFSDAQMADWRTRIEELNKRKESDNLAIYLKK